MECLYRSILPKSVPEGIDHAWLAYGIPTELACDNGPGFDGRQLAQACQEVGIYLDPGPVRTPEFKAKIERSFRRINNRLIHQLPGTLFTNAQRRGDYDSVRQACLALHEVEVLITRYLIDIYAQQFHEGIGTTPATRWEALAGPQFAPPLPKSAANLAYALGWTEYRQLHAYGIQFEHLTYNDDRLSRVREQLGRRQAKIKLHPGNLGSIAVYDPFSQDYIAPVRATDSAYAEGLALWQHRVLQRYAREEAGRVDVAALGRAKRRQRADIAAAKAKKTTAPRKEVARWDTDEDAYASHFPTPPIPIPPLLAPAHDLPTLTPSWSHESWLPDED